MYRTLFTASLLVMGVVAQNSHQTGRISIEEANERNPDLIEEAQANKETETTYNLRSQDQDYQTGRVPVNAYEDELDDLSSDEDFFDDYDDEDDDFWLDDFEAEFYDDGGMDLSHWTSTGAAGGDYFNQHLDFYNMSEDEFYQRYGYAEDPVILWETVKDRIKIDLAWVYEEDFSDFDDGDWRDFHEDVVRGLQSLDHFIGDKYGPAVTKFNTEIEQYQSMLDAAADLELSSEDWLALKQEIFRGVRKLDELARNNKLKASGALRNKVEINTVKWEEIQTNLNKLGHMTQNQFAEVHEIQESQREQLPVWAACLITGLSVALLFTLIVACGMHRQNKKKLVECVKD